MASRDEEIGQNLARMRGGLSQKDLADRMRALGWKWSQATVWSVEKGERPLRLAEADDLAVVLSSAHPGFVGASDFLWAGDELSATLRGVARAEEAVLDAIEEFLDVLGTVQASSTSPSEVTALVLAYQQDGEALKDFLRARKARREDL